MGAIMNGVFADPDMVLRGEGIGATQLGGQCTQGCRSVTPDFLWKKNKNQTNKQMKNNQLLFFFYCFFTADVN